MTEKFDLIVVGAGPAGSAAAYVAAKAGLSVLLLERGRFPGAKNVSGAVFYTDVLNRMIPNFWEEAPVERWIAHHVLSVLTSDASISVKFSKKWEKPVGVSVLRAKFDRWFAGKAEEAGAMVLGSSLVKDLIYQNGRVVGRGIIYLKRNTDYYWRIDERNACGVTEGDSDPPADFETGEQRSGTP